MTQAEKMAQDMLDDYLFNPSKWLLKPKVMDLIRQVAERTVREILLIGWHPDDEMKIASCRWWEDEHAD